VSHPISIAPSILTADFGRLAEEVSGLDGADRLHLDVMDGHFVPNLTFGPVVVSAIRKATTLPIDCHLMISTPERYVEAYRQAGADRLIIHAEATVHLHRLLQHIRSGGAEAGVALNPATPIIDLDEVLPELDYVLIMSVNPGFGGQSFIKGAVRKISRMRRLLDRHAPKVSLGVDGGIGPETAGQVVEAGADSLIAGSAVFNERASPAENIRALRAAIQGVGSRKDG
jgi:ribulose-phosphate 3-epimerase